MSMVSIGNTSRKGVFMPRGENPNSRANLQPCRTKKEARERGAKGGKASGESRKVLKTFQELDAEFTTDAERKKMLDMLKKRAEQGNLKAWELYANYMGMKPAEKVKAEVDVDSEYQESIQKIKSIMRAENE